MALVSSADFESLPTEPIPRWLKLRDLLESRLAEVTDIRDGPSDLDLVEYCTVLMSAAQALGLGSISEFSVGNIRHQYSEVRSEIIALATKLSVKSLTTNVAFSVELPRTSKTKLFSQIERLRTLITNSELSEKQKAKLFSKLDELHSIVIARRVDYAKLMGILALLSVGLQGATSFLADAPDALTTITAIIGEAKELEEEEHRLLQAEREPLKLQDLRSEGSGDDEIPF